MCVCGGGVCLCVDLGIQNEMGMSCIVVCGQPGFSIFFTFSHKRHVFRKMLLNIQCAF